MFWYGFFLFYFYVTPLTEAISKGQGNEMIDLLLSSNDIEYNIEDLIICNMEVFKEALKKKGYSLIKTNDPERWSWIIKKKKKLF